MSSIPQQWDSLILPETECGIAQACGLCEACKKRARGIVERYIKELSWKNNGRNPENGREKQRVDNRINRLICMLDIFPAEVAEEEKEELSRWAWYCTGMHALGLKGSIT